MRARRRFARRRAPRSIFSFFSAGVAHVDGSSRIQTLSKEHDPWLHGVLAYIQRLGGKPLLAERAIFSNCLAGAPAANAEGR